MGSAIGQPSDSDEMPSARLDADHDDSCKSPRQLNGSASYGAPEFAGQSLGKKQCNYQDNATGSDPITRINQRMWIRDEQVEKSYGHGTRDPKSASMFAVILYKLWSM
jgi:hypothetical protein